MSKRQFDRDEMVSLYETGLTSREVAAIVGCSKTCVAFAIKESGKSRCKAPRELVLLKKAKSCKVFTQDFLDFLDGLLISDGCITRPSKMVPTCKYQQTSTSRPWLEMIQGYFEKFGIKSRISRDKRPKKSHHHVLATHSYGEFFAVRQRWYPRNKKQIPDDVNVMSKAFWQNWVMGDGTLRSGLRLCMDSFSKTSLVRIAKDIHERLGVRFVVMPFGKSKSGKKKV